MRIAINGIGVAGPTLAYWLREFGHEPVMFEKAPSLRTDGYLIDFWGLGYEVADRMGLIPALEQRGYRMKRLSFVDERGRESAGMDVATLADQVGGRFISIPRGDLASAVFQACEGVRSHFGVSIVGVEQEVDGVSVALSDGTHERFDLLVGADGLHSRVRELVFGSEATFEHHLGCHVAAFRIPHYPHRDELTYISHTVPRRHVSRIALRDDQTLILLVFRSELLGSDAERCSPRAALRSVFGSMQWETPEILAHLDAAEVYFDRVSQVRLDRWTEGRVALVGDAAACASLLAGEGVGLAMIEAYVLAGELHRAAGDHARAFAAYEARLRPFLASKQRSALGLLDFFAPRSLLRQALRDVGIKAMSIPFLARALTARSLRDDLELPDYRRGG
jgi:2-polyprenyl-6-methoxyphenol hydroxylase-like FAD-dependent oxidoreductase